MKHIKIFCLTALATICLQAQAQFFQDESQKQWMLKVELGALPYIGNVGNPGQYGYYLNNYQAAAGLDVVGGLNLSQDFMAGLGVGGYYAMNPTDLTGAAIMATLFADLDYRPIWGTHGSDAAPQTYRFAPMAGARLGASVLLDDADRYGTHLGPYVELYAGANWYYRHGLRNMQHNWRSLYLQLGVAYMQQTVFLPVRLGWRL